MAGGAGDVEEEDIGVDSGGAELGDGLFALGEIAGADDDFDSGMAKFEGGLKAESAVAAGDECNFLGHGEFLLSGLDSADGEKGAGGNRE